MRSSNLASGILGSLALRTGWSRLRAVPAVGTLLHQVARAVLPPGPTWVVVQGGPLRGRRFLCDPRYHTGYIRGDHEPWMVRWITTFLRPGATFVDVGAHFGYFTLIAADIVGPEGRVIAFEPDPRNADILEANAAATGTGTWVEVVRRAVGAEDTSTAFMFGHDVLSRVPASRQAPEAGSIRQVCLDDYNLSTGAVIKVDVEGAEMGVLLGSRSHLAAKRTTWIIEIHGSDLEEAVLSHLRSYGYEPRVYAPVHPAYADYRQRYIVAIGTGIWPGET